MNYERGVVLRSFTRVDWPQHLSTYREHNDRCFIVADPKNQRVLLLNKNLKLEQCSVVDRRNKKDFWWPRRLIYNDFTGNLYILHCSLLSRDHWSSDVLSKFR